MTNTILNTKTHPPQSSIAIDTNITSTTTITTTHHHPNAIIVIAVVVAIAIRIVAINNTIATATATTITITTIVTISISSYCVATVFQFFKSSILLLTYYPMYLVLLLLPSIETYIGIQSSHKELLTTTMNKYVFACSIKK